MTDSQNPYTAPQAETILSIDAQTNADSYYVDGKNLVVRNGTELPNLCIKTGTPLPDGKRRKKTLYWASQAWIVLLFLGLFIYIIVYYCVRKKVAFTYSISPEVVRKRRTAVAISLSVFVGGIISAFYFFTRTPYSMALAGTLSVFASLIALMLASYFGSSFRAKKHRDGWFTITGVGKGFLQAIG